MKNILLARAAVLFVFCCPLVVFAQKELQYIEGDAQGTTYHITYIDSLSRNVKNDVERILVDFDLSVSTYIPQSIISRINNNEPNVFLDEYFLTCFNRAKGIWKSTDGYFDPTVSPLVNAWGFGPNKKSTLNASTIDSLHCFVGFEKIKLKHQSSIVKKDKRVALDFNAFAQGYSADVVAQYLDSIQITSYIIEIGGEIFARGYKEDGSDWLVGIEQPIENKNSENPYEAIIKLNNKAIATSGNYRKYYVENGVKYSHSINPKTGYPANNSLLSVTVLFNDCLTADALATSFMVMGKEKTISYLKKHPDVEAFLIYSDNEGDFQTYQTIGLKELFVELK